MRRTNFSDDSNACEQTLDSSCARWSSTARGVGLKRHLCARGRSIAATIARKNPMLHSQRRVLLSSDSNLHKEEIFLRRVNFVRATAKKSAVCTMKSHFVFDWLECVASEYLLQSGQINPQKYQTGEGFDLLTAASPISEDVACHQISTN